VICSGDEGLKVFSAVDRVVSKDEEEEEDHRTPLYFDDENQWDYIISTQIWIFFKPVVPIPVPDLKSMDYTFSTIPME
jgi:hypothetical protein